ncbi:MAG: hypothetical protein MZW92_67460 [Comamonadaceae bacterium]|nr:hypothetical protein [Comamonadaceae bacterium]
MRRAGYDAAPARDAFAAPDDAAREAEARYRRELAVFALAALPRRRWSLQMAWMLATGAHARPAAALAAVRARRAGAVRGRRALLSRRLERAARRRGEHGRAGRARHHAWRSRSQPRRVAGAARRASTSTSRPAP